MTSLACFILAAAVMVTTSFGVIARRRAIVHMLVAGVICVAFYALFLSSGMVESLGRDPTLTGRTVIWDVVLSVRGNALVGTGFESFWLGKRLHRVWELTMPGLQEAHNGYLELYLNLGWIGVILLGAVLIVTGYRNVIAAFTRGPATANRNLAFSGMGRSYTTLPKPASERPPGLDIFSGRHICGSPNGLFQDSTAAPG